MCLSNACSCLVATTISSCATSVALEGDDAAFDIVVLDECSQMVEPASMLPVLKFGCKRLLLVGDPLQLPPITRSVRELKVPSGTDPALVGGYETALFVRLQKAGYQTTMLSVQYRFGFAFEKDALALQRYRCFFC